MTIIQSLIEQNREGQLVGLPCFCTANETVLRTILSCCVEQNTSIVVEASGTQVNQDGGYTGISAPEFARWITLLSTELGVPGEHVILGGSQLGPETWNHLTPADAFNKVKNLIRDYASAGFQKIHLSAPVLSTEEVHPDLATMATRTARLCEIAEKHAPHPEQLVYVLDVLPTQAESGDSAVQKPTATTAEQLENSIGAYQEAFIKLGLRQVWPKVVSINAQSGIGFNNHSAQAFNVAQSLPLSAEILNHDGLTLSASTTDYQSTSSLTALVEQHFFFLRVGPELTFRMRQAIFALASIVNQMTENIDTDFIDAIDIAMSEYPEHWQTFYSVDDQVIKQLQRYSFHDRIRYYWNFPDVRSRVHKFLTRLDTLKLPEALVAQQFMSREFGTLDVTASQLIQDNVKQSIHRYLQACGHSSH